MDRHAIELARHLEKLAHLATRGAKQVEQSGHITSAAALAAFLGTLQHHRSFNEYVHSPRSTLRAGGGDAEDIAVLGYALALNAGLKPHLEVRTPGHIVLRVGNLDALQQWRENG